MDYSAFRYSGFAVCEGYIGLRALQFELYCGYCVSLAIGEFEESVESGYSQDAFCGESESV